MSCRLLSVLAKTVERLRSGSKMSTLITRRHLNKKDKLGDTLKTSVLYILLRFFFDWLHNKAADYHRHIFRLPILVNLPFKKMKAFFKILSFFIIFSNFSNFKNFPILSQKNLTNKVEKK